MKKIVLILAFVLLLPVVGWAADNWYLRPYQGGPYGSNNGTSYDNAWYRTADIVWGTGGIVAGDTLWICGERTIHGTWNGSNEMWTDQIIPTVSGTEGSPIIIRGDYTLQPGDTGYPGTDPGTIYHWNRYYYAGFCCSTPQTAFTGSGLNDCWTSGNCTSTTPAVYTVEIDATGTPDTFKWRKDGGGGADGVAITGASQTLTDGVAVTFTATTGHTLGDIWSITTGTNGTWQRQIAGSVGWVMERTGTTMVDFTRRQLCGTVTEPVASTRPTKAQLDLFTAGTWHLFGTLQLYIKTPTGTSPNTNPIGNIFGSAAINTSGQDWIEIKNLTIKRGKLHVAGGSDNIVIDNVTIEKCRGDRAIYLAEDCNYITIRNCTIDNCSEGIYSVRSEGNYADNVTVENCTITNIYNYGTSDAHAIAFQGGQNIIVRNNWIENAATAVTQYNGVGYTVASMEVYGNFAKDIWRFQKGFAAVYSSGSTLVDSQGRNVDSLTTLDVGDTMYNRTDGSSGVITGFTTTVNTGDTVLIAGGLSGGTNNYWSVGDVWTCRDSGGIYDGHGVAWDNQGNSTEANVFTVYNNIAVNCWNAGFRASNPYGRWKILNNTFYKCARGIACAFTGYSDCDVDNWDCRNNIILSPYDWGTGIDDICHQYAWAKRAVSNWDGIWNNNCYYPVTGTPFVFEAGGGSPTAKTWAEWQALIDDGVPTNEKNSITSDPLFTNDGGSYALDTDFQIPNTSKCIDAGYRVKGRRFDYGNRPIRRKPDIGAWEYQGTLGSGTIGGVEW